MTLKANYFNNNGVEVFQNVQKGKKGEFLSFGINRRWKDKEGNWHSGGRFSVQDLKNLRTIINAIIDAQEVKEPEQKQPEQQEFEAQE
jgi:hypothetical protein